MFVNISAKQKIGIDDLLEPCCSRPTLLELKGQPGHLCLRQRPRGQARQGPRLGRYRARDPRYPCTWAIRWSPALPTAASAPCSTPRAAPSPRPVLPTPSRSWACRSVPNAGDEFRVFEDEREARALADERSLKARIEEQSRVKHVTLENLFETIADAEVKELNLIIKADVQGSIGGPSGLARQDGSVRGPHHTIHSAVGAINETDVVLADASNAIIIGFWRPSRR